MYYLYLILIIFTDRLIKSKIIICIMYSMINESINVKITFNYGQF